jgi:hypothetical protein
VDFVPDFWFINSLFEFFGRSGGVVKFARLTPDFEFFGVVVGVVEGGSPVMQGRQLRGERMGSTRVRVLGDPSSLEQQNVSQGKTSCAGGVRHATPACKLGLWATGRFGMGICWKISDRLLKIGDVGKAVWPASSSGRPENRGNEYRTVGDTEGLGIETLAFACGEGGPAKGPLAMGIRSGLSTRAEERSAHLLGILSGGDRLPASSTDAKGAAEEFSRV